MRINILPMFIKNTLFIALPALIIALVMDFTNTKPKDMETSSANSSVTAQSSNDESVKPQIQVEPQQKSVAQTQSVEKPTEAQTAEAQTQSTASELSIDYEQKFGKRIYLATKDEFVNMRNAPSGEIIAQIYKKDFENIMIYSFDANSNEKWLKVVYFPPNIKDEQNAISGYIHISQIDKNKLN